MHRAVFGEVKPKEVDRIDYAWLVIDDKSDKAVAFVTVREMDNETVYWQFGGAFPWAKKSILVTKAYDACLSKQAEISKCATTVIDAKNTGMLKMAISRGWEIFGVRAWQGSTMVELKKEFSDAVQIGKAEKVPMGEPS